MKLTECDEVRLSAALNVALGIVSPWNANYTALGWDTYTPAVTELQWRCREIILESIIKASEPESKEQPDDN